VKIACQF